MTALLLQLIIAFFQKLLALILAGGLPSWNASQSLRKRGWPPLFF